MATWTIFGHWENNELVMDAVAEGEHQDVREEDGTWDEGYWSDSAEGETWQEAFATLKEQYEEVYD